MMMNTLFHLSANNPISLLFLENLKLVIAKQEAKVTEVEKQNAETESAKKRAATELKTLADKYSKQEQSVSHEECRQSKLLGFKVDVFRKFQAKQLEALKVLAESQAKQDKDRSAKLEKELDAERKERKRWESKVSDLDSDLMVCRFFGTASRQPPSARSINFRKFTRLDYSE